MSRPVVLAIDQGTTSVRATVLALEGEPLRLAPVAASSETVERSFPRPGWVELDAEEVVAATERVATAALADAGRPSAEIAGVGLANQGETVVVWERATGRPIAPAIVWQCRRTEDACALLRQDASTEAWVREATGLPIDAYFSATKLAWILDQVPGARARAERGELCGGTLDTFTLFRLSGGRLFVTDPSTSCRTLLAELRTGRFDQRLCDLFGVPARMLADVVASDASLGPIQVGGALLPVRAILCDQPSALLGTGCLAPGDVKCTYGTGAFLQVNIGQGGDGGETDAARPAPHQGLLRSIAWELDGARTQLLEGSVLAAGDVLTWLRDGLGMIARPDEIDEVLARTPDSGGVLFVPALTGLGAPRWVGDARGTMLGLNRASRREHVIRAALEGIAHQVADVLEVASRARGGALAPMWADGGLSSSDAFLQLQADLAGHPLMRVSGGEATTRGVAAACAVGASLAPSIAGLVRADPDVVISPSLDPATRAAARERHRGLMDVLASPTLLALCR